MNRVCVFCGAHVGTSPAFADGARALGAALGRRGLGLVYGGGNVGLMGILADAALAHGAAVIGVIPEAMVEKELAHRGVTELRIVRSMHERKATMAELADAFVALPGGYGTLDEFCEVLTWAQLGLHRKPCGLLNIEGYYAPFLAQIDHATRTRFIRPEHRAFLVVAEEANQLLDRLHEVRPPAVHQWIDRDQA